MQKGKQINQNNTEWQIVLLVTAVQVVVYNMAKMDQFNYYSQLWKKYFC